ncbi:hypothetical protein GCM10023085_14330 [Actinomadura viridis]|uniref:ADP-ribosylglycohydrolase n=1 Tax=Actinomadura viridis TaxID=58110 RepID=A0A931DPQ0_9ACTN|nr:ADP-ribosylglycohydrolase family protein [Actinomadura viridis]MBG6093805.1 ADP-ribosylglycohydrolase [Actinomadura viridis]
MPDLLPYPDRDRLLGCLLGGAIGDALGAPVEGVPLAAIRERYGPEGLTEYCSSRKAKGAVTDDTQLTMFTARALLQASFRERAKGIGGAALGMVQAAYLVWYHGQESIDPPPSLELDGGGWFGREPALSVRRGPGRSTLSALLKVVESERPRVPLGTPEDPINDSKGCGGVMRVAPCGFGTAGFEVAFDLGTRVAALTHGHPSGHLPAGVHAALVWGLLRGMEFEDALERARRELARHRGHEETSAALQAAVDLAAEGPSTPERVDTLGSGYTGHTALAIAVYAMLTAETDVPETERNARRRPVLIGRNVLLRSVNHSGDSDSTGAVAGNLAGARYGGVALPGHWQAELEVRRAVVQMAADCALEFSLDPPVRPDGHGTPETAWADRYPTG